MRSGPRGKNGPRINVVCPVIRPVPCPARVAIRSAIAVPNPKLGSSPR